MKKYFLACILLCGMTSFVSARSRTENLYKHAIGERNKREKKILMSALARKKSSAKKRNKKYTASRLRKAFSSKKSKRAKLRIPKASLISVKAQSYRELSADEMKLGNDFASNRGKLSWPVDGSISLPFGLYTIDDTRLKGDNPGILFSTADKSQPVKAVFDGVVSDVSTKGEISYVCIRHGKYSTVYSNLSVVNVNKGDIVKKNQVIARIGDGYSSTGGELTFLLMVDNDNVDPAPWLSAR